MPLSDHEQRMLDQIESALYAEDPKFASSVRGGNLRAPSTRRRLQGAGLFVIGLAMLVAGVAFRATMIGSFPILSVVGFIVMFAGVVFAITGPRIGRGRDKSGPSSSSAGPRQRRGQGRWRFVHQPHGGSLPASFRRVSASFSHYGVADRLPRFCWPRPAARRAPPCRSGARPKPPHFAPLAVDLGFCRRRRRCWVAEDAFRGGKWWRLAEIGPLCGAKWGIVGYRGG